MSESSLMQLRWLSFLVISTLILSLSVVSSAQAGLVVTIDVTLTLRAGPGTGWARVTTIEANTNMALDGRTSSGDWVRGITQNGAQGWVSTSFVPINEQQLVALPWVQRGDPFTVAAPPPAPGSTVVADSPAPAADTPAETASAANTGTAPTSGVLISATANVNMRSGPGTDFRRVGGVQNGEALNVDGRNARGDWVRGINANGTVGWTASAFYDFGGTNVGALPVVDVDTPFALAAPGGPAQPEAVADVAVPAPISGPVSLGSFSYGGHVQNLDGRAITAMRSAGMTWMKKQVRYNQGDNPAGVAGLINQAHGEGFRVLLGVVGNPAQINNGGYFNDYANFVAGLAGLGADAIEIWNEPNLNREWPTGQIDGGRYTQLLAQSYNAIKARNSSTIVISGAPAPTGFFGGCAPEGCDDNVYIAQMAAAGAANYMDCVGVHYNEGIVPPTQNSGDPRSEYYTRYFNGMVNTYYNAFGGRRPLCFTELGYLSPQGFGPLPGGFAWAQNVTVGQQAAWLGQVKDLSVRNGRVRLMIVWNVDFTNYGADPMAGYAIIRPDGTCPACDALRN